MTWADLFNIKGLQDGCIRMHFSFTIVLLHVLAAGFSPIKTNPVYLKHRYCRIYWLLALTLQIATNWMWLWLWETMVATKTCKNAKEKRLDCLFVTWWCTLNSYFTQIETKIWMLYSISAIKSYTGPLFSCLLANSSFFLSAFVLFFLFFCPWPPHVHHWNSVKPSSVCVHVCACARNK